MRDVEPALVTERLTLRHEYGLRREDWHGD
jgi:hypothetical protein